MYLFNGMYWDLDIKTAFVMFLASYFAPIVNALVSWGYKRGVSVRGVPFDFRKAPSKT
jgi:lysophospholipase-3